MCVSAKDYNLTPKQFQFCLEYVKELNGTKAYQEIYKCSYESAMVNASKLLRNTNVNACIEKLFSEITFNKQAIINQCIAIKIQLANGKITQKRIDRSAGKIIEFTPTPKDMNDATNDLLKLFGAFETTSNQDEDADVEALKDSKNNAKNENVEIKELEDESE